MEICKKKWSIIKRGCHWANTSRKCERSKYLDSRLDFLKIKSKENKTNIPKKAQSSRISKRQETARRKPDTENKCSPRVTVNQNMIDQLLEQKKHEGTYAALDDGLCQSIASIFHRSIQKKSIGVSEISLISSSSEECSIKDDISIKDSDESSSSNDEFNEFHCLSDEDIELKSDTSYHTDLELAIKSKLETEGADSNNINKFFKTLAEYTSTKLSLQKQKELRKRICTLMNKEELEFLTANVNEREQTGDY